MQIIHIPFTFGIITNGSSDHNLRKIINSIKIQKMPIYEIIIVGNTSIQDDTINIIPFIENDKKGWITRKKNIIAQKARYPYIVFLHDYFMFDSEWYSGFLKYCIEYGDFDIISNILINGDGKRFRDWSLFPPFLEGRYGVNKSHKNADKIITQGCLLPYNLESNSTLNKYIYYSGGFFIVKKKLILKYPIDETKSWGQGEDVKWCRQICDKVIFKFNSNSKVNLLKIKNVPKWNKELLDVNMLLFDI